MKRCASLIISLCLIVLTVQMTVGVTFSRCAHSGKISFGLSHEAESEGDGFNCGCLDVFTETLPEYTPSDGPDFLPIPAVLSLLRLPDPALPATAVFGHPRPEGPSAIRLLRSVLLRR